VFLVFVVVEAEFEVEWEDLDVCEDWERAGWWECETVVLVVVMVVVVGGSIVWCGPPRGRCSFVLVVGIDFRYVCWGLLLMVFSRGPVL
jgi:hypothetical protein